MLRIPATLRDGTQSGGPQIRAVFVSSYSEKINGGPQVTSNKSAWLPEHVIVRQGKNILVRGKLDVYFFCWGRAVVFICCRIYVYKTSRNNWCATHSHFGLLYAGCFNHTQALISGVSVSCGFLSVNCLSVSCREGMCWALLLLLIEQMATRSTCPLLLSPLRWRFLCMCLFNTSAIFLWYAFVICNPEMD